MRRTILDDARIWASALAIAIPAALSAQQQADRYEVGKAVPPLDPGKNMLTLSLAEAVNRALEMNLDIQTARLDPQIQHYAMEVARAAFDPTLSTNLGHNNSSAQSTSQLDGGVRTTTKRNTYNASVSQPLQWWGARLNANFNNSRTETDNAFTTRNPSYSSSLNLSYTQPLLSGLKTDNQRTTLETQEIQAQITDIQLATQVANITNQVRTAYWALRAAIEQIEIQRRSLAQAQQLLEQNRIRVRLGTMSELQVVQAESQVAGAEQSLLNAEIQWRNQELAFKSLLVGGPDDPLFLATVNPTDLPALTEPQVDIQAAIGVALEQRNDIRQQRRQLQISGLNLAVTQNNVLPDLNLTASYSLQGVGGDLYNRSGLGGEAVLVEKGGYSDGLRSIWDRDTPTWNLSLAFSYPIGNQAAKASLERARLQIRQSDLALKARELSIVTEVTNAGLTVNNTYLQLLAARRSREVAERSAEVELARFNAGSSTNYEVALAQDNLTSARLSELRATINHVNAVAEFERVQRVGR
jgi:outer membrane protein TolC